MKIGILTQPLGYNYGGILQAYALQTVLKRMGHEVLILNRRYNNPSFFLLFLRFLSIGKCFIRRYILNQKEYRIANPFSIEGYIANKNFQYDDTEILDFISHNIFFSKPLRSSSALRKCVRREQIDCLIIGSDQVWREDYSPCITDFFTGFLPEKDPIRKVVYAASFGKAEDFITPKQLKKCIKLAKRLDTVSVRELSGVSIMKNIFNRTALHVLDPTLLLNGDDYRLLIEKKDKLQQRYLLNYILDADEEKKRIAESGADILGIENFPLFLSPLQEEGDTNRRVSISRWLASFEDADFVITDSFHGCVFSILFQKTFIAIGNKKRGIDRFYSLLNRFNLQDRLLFSFNEFEAKKESLMTKIDYNTISLILTEERQKSFDYLIGSLK